MENCENFVGIFRELLTYDMYLRENLKSRPDFAKDLAPYKEFSRSFYQQEEQERRLLPGYEAYDHKQLAKMTHLEPFQYPVWDREFWKAVCMQTESYHVSEEPTFVLFDYRERDSLTGDARTVILN